MEVKGLGIDVVVIEPGDFATGFTGARRKSLAGDDAYGGRIARSVARMEKDETNGAPPEAVAKLIARAAEKKHPAPMYACGLIYKAFLLIARLIPERWVSFGIGQMYGK